MRYDNLDLIAPHLSGELFNESEVFGSAVWLWMHSAQHRNMPLHLLSALLLPAIKTRQFILASEQGKPVFYMGWASLDEEAERRYLQNPPECMPIEDWTSGQRLWVLDWVAPFDHTRPMTALLRRRLFPGACMRGLQHRGAKRGLRIIDFHGIAVSKEEARFWAEHNRPAR